MPRRRSEWWWSALILPYPYPVSLLRSFSLPTVSIFLYLCPTSYGGDDDSGGWLKHPQPCHHWSWPHEGQQWLETTQRTTRVRKRGERKFRVWGCGGQGRGKSSRKPLPWRSTGRWHRSSMVVVFDRIAVVGRRSVVVDFGGLQGRQVGWLLFIFLKSLCGMF